MSEKDFLSQFSNENKKPESFKEEVRVPVHKERKPVNKGLLIGVIVAVAVLSVAVYFIFFAPKIEMPDFVGKNKSDVAAWVKQQGIESSGIIFEEEYDFDSEEGEILYQSIDAGKKVKENVKLNFTVSLGADPSERIEVPDLESMDKAEIQEWISENKLSKTKISTSYSDSVEENAVISFEFTGCEEDTFTRSSTLKISISKGVAPAGTITLEDFSGKSYAYVETWAKNKKINLTKTEQFSDKVSSDCIITQSILANKTMKEGETLEVVVSKGEGVVIPDFNTMSKESVNEWLNRYSVSVKDRYSDSTSYIVEQSLASGTTVSLSELNKMEVVRNLGNSFYLSEEGFGSIVGKTYNELEDLCNEKRSKGIDAYAANWDSSNEEYSYFFKRGEIVSVKYISNSTGKEYYENDRMPLDIRFKVVVSKGLISKFKNIDYDHVAGTFNKKCLVDALANAGISFTNMSTVEYCYLKVNGSTVDPGKAFEIKETDTVLLCD